MMDDRAASTGRYRRVLVRATDAARMSHNRGDNVPVSGRRRDPDRRLIDRYRDLRLARMDGAPPLVSDPRSRLPTELFGVNLLSKDQTLRATRRLWSSRADCNAICNGGRKTDCDRSDQLRRAHTALYGLSVRLVIPRRDRSDPLRQPLLPTDQKVRGSNPSERADKVPGQRSSLLVVTPTGDSLSGPAPVGY